VVDGATPRVGPRIEEGAADRVLPVEREDRPASPVVVPRLADVELPRNSWRHAADYLTVRPLIVPNVNVAVVSRC
jgi:hypothetical protein